MGLTIPLGECSQVDENQSTDLNNSFYMEIDTKHIQSVGYEQFNGVSRIQSPVLTLTFFSLYRSKKRKPCFLEALSSSGPWELGWLQLSSQHLM